MKKAPEINKDTKKEVLEKLGKDCEKCGHCCSFGSGFILDEEIEELAKALGKEEEEFKENYLEEITKFNTKLHRFKLIRENPESKLHGRCVFLEENKCIIQEIKPLHCRITSCKEHGKAANEWFIVNFFVNPADPQSIREWGLRIKINQTIKGGELESLVKDKSLLDKMMKREI